VHLTLDLICSSCRGFSSVQQSVLHIVFRTVVRDLENCKNKVLNPILFQEQLKKAYQQSESQLRRALLMRKADVKAFYGDLLLADSRYGGSKGNALSLPLLNIFDHAFIPNDFFNMTENAKQRSKLLQFWKYIKCFNLQKLYQAFDLYIYIFFFLQYKMYYYQNDGDTALDESTFAPVFEICV